MAHWRKPSEEIPEKIEVGDRIAIVVREQCPHTTKPRLIDRLIILEATEIGWEADNEADGGYTREDGIAWTTEKEIISDALAKVTP